jgi:hypothetical protein
MNVHAKQTAATTGLAALLMLLYGWYGGGPQGVSSSDLYNSAIDLFRWMLRIGGMAMLLTSVVCFTGLRVGLLLDFLVTGLCGAIMLGVGVIGLFAGGAPGLQDILVLIFGLVFLRAAWSSWALHGEAGQPAESAVAARGASAPEAAHPASVHPEALPKDGEPPPADGYLSALAKEKEEPPSASYE